MDTRRCLTRRLRDASFSASPPLCSLTQSQAAHNGRTAGQPTHSDGESDEHGDAGAGGGPGGSSHAPRQGTAVAVRESLAAVAVTLPTHSDAPWRGRGAGTERCWRWAPASSAGSCWATAQVISQERPWATRWPPRRTAERRRRRASSATRGSERRERSEAARF